MKDARAVIHTDHRGGRDGIEADGGHRAESETKACSRIAVVAFSQVRWYLGTPPSAKGGGQLESAGHATVAVKFGGSRGLPMMPHRCQTSFLHRLHALCSPAEGSEI